MEVDEKMLKALLELLYKTSDCLAIKIALADINDEPYNFKRTGCLGCPFNIKLQDTLDTLEKTLPLEKKKAEAIWKEVYQEYRKLNYRLKR